MNVDPFMNNRVRLKVPEGQNDYINASPITLKSARTGRRKDYIATQVSFFLVYRQLSFANVFNLLL